MSTIGDRIREIRTEQDLTQEELAKRTDISKGFLSDVENGKRGIGADYLLRIANVLGASLEYLMRGDAPTPAKPEPIVIPLELSDAAQQLCLSYSETIELLAASKSVVARRSAKLKKKLTVDGWKKLHYAIKEAFG